MAGDPLVKVVADCSLPDREAVVAYTQDQVEAVLQARVDGRLTSEETAERLVALADQAVEAGGIPDRITIVPLDDDELADYHDRQAQALEDTAAQKTAQTDRAALVAKLTAGKATVEETQQALAALLGGTSERVVKASAVAPEVSDATKLALEPPQP